MFFTLQKNEIDDKEYIYIYKYNKHFEKMFIILYFN